MTMGEKERKLRVLNGGVGETPAPSQPQVEQTCKPAETDDRSAEATVTCEAIPARRVTQTYYGDKLAGEKTDFGVVVTCGRCKRRVEQMGEALFKHLGRGGTAEGQCHSCGAKQHVVAAQEKRIVLASNAQASAEIAAARLAQAMRGTKP